MANHQLLAFNSGWKNQVDGMGKTASFERLAEKEQRYGSGWRCAQQV